MSQSGTEQRLIQYGKEPKGSSLSSAFRLTVNRAFEWLSRRHELANIRDGIYRVDFKSKRPEGDGIPVIRKGVLRGLDRECVYSGVFTPMGDGRIACRVQSERHPTYGRRSVDMQATSAKTRAISRLVGTETENGFHLSAESEAGRGSHHEIRGTLVAELWGTLQRCLDAMPSKPSPGTTPAAHGTVKAGYAFGREIPAFYFADPPLRGSDY
jgi:hypothetical protein